MVVDVGIVTLKLVQLDVDDPEEVSQPCILIPCIVLSPKTQKIANQLYHQPDLIPLSKLLFSLHLGIQQRITAKFPLLPKGLSIIPVMPGPAMSEYAQCVYMS